MSQYTAEIKGFPPPFPLGLPVSLRQQSTSEEVENFPRIDFLYLLALFLEFLCDMYVRVLCKKMG